MPPAAPKKVLILCGDQEFAKTIGEQLHVASYETFILADPARLLAELANIRPDMLIFDMNIPGMNAFPLLEAIRQNPDKAIGQMAIIIASQTGDLVEVGKALQLGVKDYFVKTTTNPRQVLAKVSKHLGDVETLKVLENPATQLAAVKLLIVEDDKFLRDLAAQKLSREHLNVVTAVDGEQGIAVAEKELPDIILLDILLPGIDGFEVLKRIRANHTLDKASVVMLSNFGQREDIEKALSAGAQQFMVKANYTLDEIVEEVKKIIATRQV